MPAYYKFINKTIDLIISDENEQVMISDTLDKQLLIRIYKITKEKVIGKIIYERIFDPAITKELRLYLNGGNDNVVLRNNNSPVTIRIVGDAQSAKTYEFNGAAKYL